MIKIKKTSAGTKFFCEGSKEVLADEFLCLFYHASNVCSQIFKKEFDEIENKLKTKYEKKI